MSDQQMGMKMVEQVDLDLFLDAYEDATGEVLSLYSSERPDFVGEREDATPVGVELTKVTRDPEFALWDSTFYRRDFMQPQDALDLIFEAIEVKEIKRSSGAWTHPENTILVIQLCDCPLSDLAALLDEEAELPSHGFAEIWIADQSELDAYGQVELFCLHPDDRWGYYERDRGKPYG